jgi:hypothetical protein
MIDAWHSALHSEVQSNNLQQPDQYKPDQNLSWTRELLCFIVFILLFCSSKLQHLGYLRLIDHCNLSSKHARVLFAFRWANPLYIGLA